MDARDGLAERFEGQRDRLRAVAHRMLGSPEEADDAVQEAWLRLSRVDAGAVDNLEGWLRTVVTRICLDVLRTRTSRREDLAEPEGFDEVPGRSASPEATALLTDSVSQALLVVLDRLGPAERVALVLHDMYAVPFHEIAPIVERTPVATKKLASRARRKVRGTPALPAADLARHRRVVTAFLTAARAGDLPAVLALLAPDVVRRADPAVLPPGVAPELRGARAVAEGTLLFAHRSRQAEPALVDGAVGLLVAPHGRLRIALTFTVEDDRITGYEVIADPARLRGLEIGVLG
ncbi:sigma-70 family RNA polymerase sigma factor [Streptomyces rimosus]|uniref:sigma-70 family RNA polymerase sigma factor n=1 Tax=Streptomyces rimosus TaxID=1927 RepID=UPI0004CACEDA|nr:sigma-70 family RNA polymerase sigma factor [Streptomyces rimosus]